MKEAIIKTVSITKVYERGSERIRAVDAVDLEIYEGDFASFVGPSGSGKTTLLHILGCLDSPTDGYLQVAGTDVFVDGKTMNEAKLTKLRRDMFGYIFQKFYLIPTLNVKENIMLPFAFKKSSEKTIDAEELADKLGISHRLKHLPKEISGGEMQRVAIARSLINNPKILLADEPTGNLDSKRSEEIAEILSRLNSEMKITIILVTHNQQLAKQAGKTFELLDGKLINRI